MHWLAPVVGNWTDSAEPEAATALAWAGFLANEDGRRSEAAALGEAGLAAARRSGDPSTIVRAMLLHSTNRIVEGDRETVERYLDEAIPLATLGSDPYWLGFAHSFAAETRRMDGREDDAMRHYALALDCARATGDRFLTGLQLVNSAHVQLKRGNVALAHDQLAEAWEGLKALGNDWGRAFALIAFAGIAVAEGRIEASVSLTRPAVPTIASDTFG